MLTLRKRYSTIRREPTRVNSEPLPARPVDDATANPWQDASSPTSRRPRQALNHRLSFDHASGVIMLPDDGEWLEDDDSDSDAEDPGAVRAGATPRAETMPGAEPTEASALNPSTSPGGRRYGTYFHHPERRKRVDSRVL